MKAIDFANKEERSKFKHFNTTTFYKLKLKDNTECCYCGKDYSLKFNLILCNRCKKKFLNKDNNMFKMDFIYKKQALKHLEERGIKYNIDIIEEKVLIMM